MIGIIYKNGVEIDRGVWEAGKHYTPAYPDQSITIADSADAYSVVNERTYEHGDGISFQEIQDGGHIAYDSNEGVAHTINYDLPRWFTHGGSIPNYKHEVGSDGQEKRTYKGVVR